MGFDYKAWFEKEKVWTQISPGVIEAAAQWLADREEEIEPEYAWMKLSREDNLYLIRQQLAKRAEHFAHYGTNVMHYRVVPRDADFPDGIGWCVWFGSGLAIGYRRPGIPEIIYAVQAPPDLAPPATVLPLPG